MGGGPDPFRCSGRAVVIWSVRAARRRTRDGCAAAPTVAPRPPGAAWQPAFWRVPGAPPTRTGRWPRTPMPVRRPPAWRPRRPRCDRPQRDRAAQMSNTTGKWIAYRLYDLWPSHTTSGCVGMFHPPSDTLTSPVTRQAIRPSQNLGGLPTEKGGTRVRHEQDAAGGDGEQRLCEAAASDAPRARTSHPRRTSRRRPNKGRCSSPVRDFYAGHESQRRQAGPARGGRPS